MPGLRGVQARERTADAKALGARSGAEGGEIGHLKSDGCHVTGPQAVSHYIGDVRFEYIMRIRTMRNPPAPKPAPAVPTINIQIGVSPALAKFLDRLIAVLESSQSQAIQQKVDALNSQLAASTTDLEQAEKEK